VTGIARRATPLFAALRTFPKLGFGNLFRIAVYRFLLKCGAYRLQFPPRPLPTGPYWNCERMTSSAPVPRARWAVQSAEALLDGRYQYFSSLIANLGFPPDWHANPFGGLRHASSEHWTKIDEFTAVGADIKLYWEPSRFEALLRLAVAAIVTGESHFMRACEIWLADWSAANPANVGCNWKCAQETSIRLMHVLLAAALLEHHRNIRPAEALRAFVDLHCRRIAGTMIYAVAQDNNHATSEAAGLYIAGVWLRAQGDRRGERWERLGRKWLEDRANRLIMADGSFSQNSVNYHRLMLDTLTQAEVWRNWLNHEPFSPQYYSRCRAATAWLAAMTDPVHGAAPNLGGNDGARILVLHELPYGDFRPSVQLASVVFLRERAYSPGPWDEPLHWLRIQAVALPESLPVGSRAYPHGGYVKLHAGATWILLRLPRYRFRPSHADGLHLDLWHRGENVLRDAGTYSYNTDPEWLAYFSGTVAHNTIQFDDRDQMPRIGRFLFGDWLECERLEFDGARNTSAASYRDAFGAMHDRVVTLGEHRCIVTDTIRDFATKAVLRWRLAPHEWHLAEGCATGTLATICVKCTSDIVRMELTRGWESRHYGEKTELPVLEVEVDRQCTLQTTIELPLS
jgi:hypothetical protein